MPVAYMQLVGHSVDSKIILAWESLSIMYVIFLYFTSVFSTVVFTSIL